LGPGGLLCLLSSGPAWRDGRLSSAVIRGWAQSEDRWWRRAALVSTVALSRRGEVEDVRRGIEVCALAVSDRDDMVVKALSWALRELVKKHAREARRFLARHKGRLAARVTREVRNKIGTGLKNPRRGWDRRGEPDEAIEDLSTARGMAEARSHERERWSR